jgi:hypothetical protein
MSMLHVKDIKFVIYGVSFEQSDMNTLITEYETDFSFVNITLVRFLALSNMIPLL